MNSLRRETAGRIAYNTPLERERRLLHVSGNIPPGGNGPNVPEQPEEKRRGGGEKENTIERERAQEHQLIMGAVPDVQDGFPEALEERDLLHEVLERPGPAEGTLRTLIQEQLQKNPDGDFFNVEPGAMSDDERRTLLRLILRAHPEMTLQLARKLQDEIDQFEEPIRSIERKLEIAFGKRFPLEPVKQKFWEDFVPKKQLAKEYLDEVQRMEQTLTAIPNERIAEIVKMMEKPQENVELDGRAIATKLGWLRPYQPPGFYGPEQSDQSLTDEQKRIIHFFLELKGTIHRKRKAGARRWWKGEPSPSDDEISRVQQEYIRNLERQRNALNLFLDTQISEHAKSVVSEHRQLLEQISKRLNASSEDEARLKLLTQEGIGNVAFLDAVDDHLKPLRELGLLEEEAGPRVRPTNEGFLAYAQEALAMLAQSQSTGSRSLEKILQDKKRKQREVDEWAEGMAFQLRRLNQLPDGPRKQEIEEFLQRSGGSWKTIEDFHDLFEPYAYRSRDPKQFEELLRQHPWKRILATDPDWEPFEGEIPSVDPTKEDRRPLTKRKIITAILHLFEKDPHELLEADDSITTLNMESETLKSVADAEIWRQILETRANLAAVLTSIESSAYLQHDVCKSLDIEDLLAEKGKDIEDMLSHPNDLTEKAREKLVTEIPRLAKRARFNLPHAKKKVQELREAQKRLNALRVQPEALDGKTRGYFRGGIIGINTKKSETLQQNAHYHESGHAVLWALEPAFPFLLAEEIKKLKDRASDESGETFEAILRSLATFEPYQDIILDMDKFRGMARERLQRSGELVDENELATETDRLFLEGMLEELLVRYADWVHIRKRQSFANESPEQRKEKVLFSMLEGNRRSFSEAQIESLSNFAPVEERTRYQRHEEDEEEHTEGMEGEVTAGAAGGGGSSAEKVNIHLDLQDVRHNIELIEGFVDAYKDEHPEIREIFQKRIDATEQAYRAFSLKFLEIGRSGAVPEEDLDFVRQVRQLKKYSADIVDEIKTIDVEQLDISRVPPVRQPGIFDGIRFMSVNDVVKLWKDTMEDFVTIYKRRQDRVLKDVGAQVTEALGVGGRLPYIGEYFAGLRGYHERRYSGSDVEAANKWKDGMKYIDSHKIFDMLAITRDRDELRGGIDLLVERGDMDWNNVGIWRTMQRMSGYHMPEKACLRDDVLRDTWIRKMVHEIWKDKEQYYHWRQHNDDHIKSNKSSFTPTADQLANVDGGMSTELRKQLKLWVEWNEEKDRTGHHPPTPDDVKPHLYEEVLHYAMRNGKMRMEDKFFYLVQGVSQGILSIDRLRVLAGEGGEILLRFPFIDYFYQKNNTFPEVKRLAKRLEERDPSNPNARFRPGAKTMYFLQYELPQSESFQHRLSKALGRDNIEKIDHEDFPMIVGQIDYDQVKNITGLLSGDRFKITKESAKNSYVGFNTKFKAYARLVDMENAGKVVFSKADARSIAISITSFVHFDNIMTKNGLDKEQRQSLTWNEINNTTGPSTNGMVVKTFRDGALSFINNLIDALQEHGFNWEQNVGISRERFLQKVGEERDAGGEVRKDVFHAVSKFQKELERVLDTSAEARQNLKRVLQRQADRNTDNYIMEESASHEKEYLTHELAQVYFQERAQEERMSGDVHAATAAHGPDHH